MMKSREYHCLYPSTKEGGHGKICKITAYPIMPNDMHNGTHISSVFIDKTPTPVKQHPCATSVARHSICQCAKA